MKRLSVAYQANNLSHKALLGALIFFLMCMSALAAEYLRPAIKLSDIKPKINLEDQIPAEFGSWKEDTSLAPVLPSADLLASLNEIYSQTLGRTYINGKGQRLMLSIAYGTDQLNENTQVHRPEFCYVAQGFSIEDTGKHSISISNNKTLVAERLIGRSTHRLEPITYWIILDEQASLPGIQRKLTQIKIGLQGNIPDGMLVRVSTIDAPVDESFELQNEFIAELYQVIPSEFRRRYFGL